ncbi:MAG: hypothetical protein ACR2QF_01335 [Geminicoccaceae bacterium]
MARAGKMKGPPTENAEVIRAAADSYYGLAGELDEKRAATKATTGGKTAWRKKCVQQRVDPVRLADAAELVISLKANPEKVSAEWKRFNAYLEALGFFEMLQPGFFDDHDAEQAARSIA